MLIRGKQLEFEILDLLCLSKLQNSDIIQRVDIVFDLKNDYFRMIIKIEKILEL